MSSAAEMSWDEIKALVAELAVQSKETDQRSQERSGEAVRLLNEGAFQPRVW